MTPAVDFARPVLKKLDSELEAECDAVIGGVSPDNYREKVGYIRGLRRARQFIVDRLGSDADLLNHR